MSDAVAQLGRSSDWSSYPVAVLGAALTGQAAAAALRTLGAPVTVVEGDEQIPADTELVVASPGIPPTHGWFRDALARGLEVWSGEQLAWQLRPTPAAPWYAVTGTNGKTTTVSLIDAIFRRDGRRSVAVGNIGVPLVTAVMEQPDLDALVVELSSFQLHFTPAIEPECSVLLNIGVDHIDWHGSFAEYTADKARVFTGTRSVMVFNADDPVLTDLAQQAHVAPSVRRVGFTLGQPSRGMVGIVDDVLVDNAFADEGSPVPILPRRELFRRGDHVAANALAAIAVTRGAGVSANVIADAIRSFHIGDHRGEVVAEVGGVRYVDDSKATNVDAAKVAITAYPQVVWVAGGLAKGADFDDLVAATAEHLRAAVLLGADRKQVAAALQRHAPQVPVIEVVGSETDVMDAVVDAAAGCAAAGDTVLLAPACASFDQFSGYAARGDAFVAAVRRHADRAVSA